MTEPVLTIPAGGWSVDDLDAFPESHHRYELTDGALTVSASHLTHSPSPRQWRSASGGG